jgi:predicted  nucleic acid-binding Zn-ribbon protein
MHGDLLREPNATATEVSLYQKKVIAFLEQQIEIGKTNRQMLERQLTTVTRDHQRTEGKLTNGLKEIIRLRKLTAKLQVRIDDLNLENKRVREESELALKDIEANLDAALLQTISGKRGN